MPSFKLKPFLIGLLVTILVVACQNNTVRQPTNSKSLADCRTVQHALGETCVPKKVQRLVTLEELTLADALAVGVKPIGSAKALHAQPNYLTDKIEDLEFVGKSKQPDLEKIFQLNPDLIVGIKYNAESIYPQLSQIAPTAPGRWNGHPSWREHFNFVARVLSKESEAKMVWKNYEQRIKEFQTALGERAEEIEVSVAYVRGGNISVLTENSFPGSILADIGIRRPKSHAASEGGRLRLSEERLSILDADILFLTTDEDESSQRELADWQQKPLWNQLKVVQNKQVYIVDYDIWRGCNPIAANLLIDDLYKHLVEQS